MICDKCEQVNREDATYCDACGASLDLPSPQGGPHGIADSEGRDVPPSADAFVGREAELAELKAALNSAISGQGRLAMPVGEPGAGKTTTARQLAAHAQGNGVQVLWGRCHETPGGPPYWPWVQLINGFLRETDTDVVRQDMGAGAADVAEIVPDLQESFPDIQPSPALDDPDQARFRLFESITKFLKRAAENHPLLLFLDDLHWADKSSLLLLEFLASEMGVSKLMIVGTYRDIEVSRQHPLSETLAGLTREPVFMRVELRGLSKGEIGALVQRFTGSESPTDVIDAIHARTEGNPLFVNEVVRMLSEEGTLSESPTGNLTAHAQSLSIPIGVKEVIGKRLNRLSGPCIQSLTMASVIGREFDLAELSSLVDQTSEERLLENLDEAIAESIIEELPQALDRYQFSHVLIRETLYDELSASRRARLHQRIGEAMETIHAADLGPHLGQLAYHFSEARQDSSNEKAIGYCEKAGDRNLALLAYEEASLHYAQALHILNRAGEAALAKHCSLLLSLGEAQRREGAYSLAMESFDQAFKAAKAASSTDDLARAAIGYEDSSWRPGLHGGPAVDLLSEALESMEEDSVLKTKVMAGLVRALDFSGMSEQARELSVRAMGSARQTNDVAAIVYALDLTVSSNRGPENLQERLAATAEVLELASRSDDVDAVMDVYSWHISDLLELGDGPAARRAIDAFQQQAENAANLFIPTLFNHSCLPWTLLKAASMSQRSKL